MEGAAVETAEAAGETVEAVEEEVAKNEDLDEHPIGSEAI